MIDLSCCGGCFAAAEAAAAVSFDELALGATDRTDGHPCTGVVALTDVDGTPLCLVQQ